MATRLERLDDILDEYPPEDPSQADECRANTKRYLIVQQYDGPSSAGSWIVNVDDLGDAESYTASSVGDESGYLTLLVMDLDTGARYEPDYHVTWREYPAKVSP